jgi:hypothetical protein
VWFLLGRRFRDGRWFLLGLPGVGSLDWALFFFVVGERGRRGRMNEQTMFLSKMRFFWRVSRRSRRSFS